MRMMDIEDQQAAIRDLIRRMMDETGLDATGLARAAGIAPSTLSRFLYQPVKHLLTARTLAKLAEASGVPVPVGSPLTSELEREVLEGLRSTDKQGQEMILRFVRSLRRPDQHPPAPPSPQPEGRTRTPPFFVVGNAKGKPGNRPQLKVVRQRDCPVVDVDRR